MSSAEPAKRSRERARKEKSVLRAPRDTKDSGVRLNCSRSGKVKLTLAEFRKQVPHNRTRFGTAPTVARLPSSRNEIVRTVSPARV